VFHGEDVSEHDVRDRTLPLHIEILYNEYNIVAAFSVAILLLVMALIVLLLRQWSEARLSRQLKANDD